jgi:hypothetical protein
MPNSFILPVQVVNTGLGLLERGTVAARAVTRDAAGNFSGARDETISIRVPAYATAGKRALRSGTAKRRQTLHERKVDVSLTDELNIVVGVSSEDLTLSIENFNRQITAPASQAIARGIEDEVIATLTGADYAVTLGLDEDDPRGTFIDANTALFDARVPVEQRIVLAGSSVVNALAHAEALSDYRVGDPTASSLAAAIVGSVDGLPVAAVPGMPRDVAIVMHQSAAVLNLRAPAVPEGVAWGASESFEGFALRVARRVDDELNDNLYADVYIGSSVVTDFGSFVNGVWVPGENPNDAAEGEDEFFVRAVKVQIGYSA